jgi:hypothetical protein
MRRLASLVVALAGIALLASCSFNPLELLSGSDRRLSHERMEQILDAINDQDAATLKSMFTEYALAEYSAEIDEGLEYLLSLFPDGDVVWEDPERGPGHTSWKRDGLATLLLPSLYRVSSDGKDYWLYFADFTENEIDPDNVGVYGMGVAPRTAGSGPAAAGSGPEGVFFSWTSSFKNLYDLDADVPPGVYVPNYDNTDLSNRTMADIVEDLNAQDVSGLRVEKFTEYVRTEYAAEIDDELEQLFALFPSGDLVWQELPDGPVVRERVEGDEETILLLSMYAVSSGGKDFWLSFADFTVNTIDSSNLGIYAIGVAPRTESGDSAQERALFAWLDSFDVDASSPPGVLLAQ